MDLSKYISELLKENDCVIIPDFGGFIGNYKPAEINLERGLIYPPSKSLLFNEKLKTNDGLLGHELAKKEDVSYEESLALIREKMLEWQNILNEGGRITIGELGFLYRQNERVVFEQSREINLLLSAYGLAPVKILWKETAAPKREIVIPELKQEETKVVPLVTAKPVVEEQKAAVVAQEEVQEIVEELEREQTVVVQMDTEQAVVEEKVQQASPEDEKVIPLPRKKRRILRYVAVAAILPLAFYSVWIPAQTDFLETGKIQFSDFNPIHQSAEKQYEKRDVVWTDEKGEEHKNWDELTASLSENVSIYNYQFNDDLYIPVRLNEKESSDILTVNESTEVVEDKIEKPTVVESNSSLPYHIIAGCFSVEENATNLINDLQSKGYAARLLDKNKGLYRVTAGDFSDRSQAQNAHSQLESAGYSNWILKQ